MEKNFETLGLNPVLSRMREKRRWLSKEKNWAISNTKILVWIFFIYPDWIICVRKVPTLEVDCYLSSPNWYGCTKLLEIVWNCILSPMTFSINLPSMFNNAMGWKDLGESYNDLFGFGMIIHVKVLKWEGQCPRLI